MAGPNNPSMHFALAPAARHRRPGDNRHRPWPDLQGVRTGDANIPNLHDTRTTGAGRLHRDDGPRANDGLTARPGPIGKRDLIRIEGRARVSNNGRTASPRCRRVGLLGLGRVRWLG